MISELLTIYNMNLLSILVGGGGTGCRGLGWQAEGSPVQATVQAKHGAHMGPYNELATHRGMQILCSSHSSFQKEAENVNLLLQYRKV